MDIYLCFDVEDLVHPDSDDIPRDIAALLADDGVVASMYVVGEKARLWERRGRWDVIGAVAQHDVGLHTDHHSVHPTASEYLADKGWDDGIAEALRQEGPAAGYLARLFGQYPSSWGTSGSSWAPQIPAATRRMGIPTNIYSHAEASEDGPCWFAGQLCFSRYLTIRGGENAYCDDTAFEAALPDLVAQVQDAQRHGASCVGLFGAHPTRLRYTVFWDVLNYARGQNTPPDAYRFAPRRTDAEYATALRNLRRLAAAVQALPGVTITSPRRLSARFVPEDGAAAWGALGGLAEAVLVGDGIAAWYPVHAAERRTISAAAALDLLARAVLRLADGGEPPAYMRFRSVLGPTAPAPDLAAPLALAGDGFVAVCRELATHVATAGGLSSVVQVQGVRVGPGPLLKACAAAFLAGKKAHALGEVIMPPASGEPELAQRLAQAAIYDRLPGWPPHRPDLRLDLLALHTRLQSWSLSPAEMMGA